MYQLEESKAKIQDLEKAQSQKERLLELQVSFFFILQNYVICVFGDIQ